MDGSATGTAPDARTRPASSARATAVPAQAAQATEPWRARPIAAAAAARTAEPAVATTDSPGRPRLATGGRSRRLPAAPRLRIVAWQLALATALLAAGRPWPVATALLGSAATVLAVTTTRLRGRWVSDLMGRRIALTLRPRRRDLAAGSPAAGRTTEHDAADALLDLLAPAARLHAADLAGYPTGLISRPTGLVAAIALRDGLPGRLTRLALSGDLRQDRDPDMPAVAVRLILHRGPAGAQPAPVRAWLEVTAHRDVDISADADLRVALTNTVRRTVRRTRHAGLTAGVLSEPELRATLTALAHTGAGRSAVREDWRHWRAGPIAQAGLRVTGPALDDGPDAAVTLECLLGAVPGVACTLVTGSGDVGSGGGSGADGAAGADSSAVLRIASNDEAAVDAAAAHLRRIGPRYGLRIERLDGLHARALAATLPIGGGRP